MSKTLGESRVRTEFNVDKNTLVDQIKQKSAELINLCEEQRSLNNINITNWSADDTKEFNRLLSLAQTAYEEAGMWAVKAVTS